MVTLAQWRESTRLWRASLPVLVSFFWGAVAFQESISNIPLAMVALLMLVIGIVGLCACNATITIQLPSSLEFLYATPFFARPIDYSDLPAIATEEPIKPQEIPSTHSFDYSESSSLLQPETPAAADSAEFTRRNWIVGMTCASLVGYVRDSLSLSLSLSLSRHLATSMWQISLSECDSHLTVRWLEWQRSQRIDDGASQVQA